MSIQTEINRLNQAKTDLKAAIEGKGVAVPNTTSLDGYAAKVAEIVAADIFTGATETQDGTSGLVPQPRMGQQDTFLKGDGTWDTPSSTKIKLVRW